MSAPAVVPLPVPFHGQESCGDITIDHIGWYLTYDVAGWRLWAPSVGPPPMRSTGGVWWRPQGGGIVVRNVNITHAFSALWEFRDLDHTVFRIEALQRSEPAPAPDAPNPYRDILA